jgi:ABC-type multidrug transport system fused ATPase/permease subunit
MKGLGATGRIFSLLDREPVIPASTPGARALVMPPAGGTLRFEDVRFAYPSRPGSAILDGFSLEVRPGESVALVGQSGSGKSSVNALLLRYYDPSAGRITFDGVGECTLVYPRGGGANGRPQTSASSTRQRGEM